MKLRSILASSLAAIACSGPNPLYHRSSAVTDSGFSAESPAEAATPAPDAPGAAAVGPDAAEAAAPGTQPTDAGATIEPTDAGATMEAMDVGSTMPPMDAASPEVEAPVPSRLVGYWKLDETTGTIAADSSGNGLVGALEGLLPAVPWVPTSRGGGLNLPIGVPTAGLRVGDVNAVPQQIKALQHFTIAAWTFRAPTNVARHMSVMSWQSQYLDDKDVFNLTFAGPQLLLYVSDRPGESVVAQAPLTVGAGGGEWLHVAGSFDGQYLRLYVNGVLAAPALPYARSLVASPYPVFIGTNKNPKAIDQPFEGTLDEVVLYSEALDDAGIAKLRDGVVPLR